MSNPIITGAKIGMKRSALSTIDEAIQALNLRSEEVLKAVDGAETEEDLTAVEASVEEIVNIMHGVAQSHVPRSAFIGVVVQPPPNFIIKANDFSRVKMG